MIIILKRKIKIRTLLLCYIFIKKSNIFILKKCNVRTIAKKRNLMILTDIQIFSFLYENIVE